MTGSDAQDEHVEAALIPAGAVAVEQAPHANHLLERDEHPDHHIERDLGAVSL
jgi:hypothetical protein